MSGLVFKVDPSPSLPDKPLKDPSVGVDLVGGTVSYDVAQKLSGVKFGFAAEGNASLAAFNSLDDKDVDGILGVPISGEDVFKIVLPPQIQLTENDAWLKYRVAATLKVSASGEVAPVAFKLDGSKSAIFTDFHVHSRDDNTRTAVKRDVGSLRFAGNAADILALGDKEALSYQVRGELSASLTLSWSDVLTASVSSLNQWLNSGTLLTLNIVPSASVTFHVGLVDDFRVVFTKSSSNKIRVAIKKSDSREVGAAAELGVTVKFADDEAIKTALKKLVDSIVGQPVSVIDNVFKKATLEDLTAAERKVIDELVKRLGLADVAHTLSDLKEKWAALKSKIYDNIDKVGKAKVALAFSYEYLRIRTQDSLLVIDVDSTTLNKFHNDLMLCKITLLLEWVQANQQALVKYINQQTLTRSHAWGFSLGLGPWNVGGKDKRELTSVIQHNIQGDERIAYMGLRGYEGTWVGDKADWQVDFKADMADFAKKGSANTCQFKYGLHIKWLWKEKKLQKSELEGFLDYAVIWRIISQDNIKDILEQMTGNFGKSATVSLELTLDDAALRSILPLADSASTTDLPVTALAKAMPFMSLYDGRRTATNREICYAPLWKYYFQNDSLPIDTFPSVAANEIQKITQLKHIADGAGLASREKGTSSTSKAYQDFFTFAGQIYYHGQTAGNYSGIHKDWLSFAKGLTELNTAIKPDSCANHKKIEDIFNHLTRFWSQTLYVRTVGVFLTEVAAANTGLLKTINRALTIAPKGAETFLYSSG